nr:immunoglobulin light chain junction region [Macaca mulatta]MOX10272.1 immunoglobulin light chain junction region [Macaca mulatta]
CQQGDAYPYSF